MSWNTNQEGLQKFFEKYGAIDSCKLLTDRDTGRSKGIGFVEFNTRAEAKKAIADADNLNLDGRLLTVSFSNENRPTPGATGGQQRPAFGGGDRGSRPDNSAKTIFVGNLSFNADEDTVKEFFSSCGNVVGVRLAKSPEGELKGYCHVEFDAPEAVQSAMALNGSDLGGRNIRIDASKPSGSGGAGGRGGFRGGDRGGFRGGRGGGRGGFGGGFNRGGDDGDRAMKKGAIIQGQGQKKTFDD